jgi:peptide methionine sulfoxide reductase msrA/msrB
MFLLRSKPLLLTFTALFVVGMVLYVQHTLDTRVSIDHTTENMEDSGERETVTLAGGCFWCTEAYLQEVPGVVDAVSGYAGGSAETADYVTVSSGETLHREAVQVTFDPQAITLEEILDVYWAHIDPTDSGGQFADRGHHYTTAVYYHTDAQSDVVLDSKQRLEESDLFDEPIATEVLPFVSFFEAEEYHQDYYKKSAAHYERYKKASGRAGFIKDTWAKDAALAFFESGGTAELPQDDGYVYVARGYTEAEVESRRKNLGPLEYRVLAKEGTERAFQNEYWDNKEEGIYVDRVTGKPLFSSTHKFVSGTGWPSFYKTIEEDALTLYDDFKLLTPRTEMRSVGGHVGHVFSDGPQEHGGLRYCANSAALYFVPKGEMVEKGYGEWLYLFES